MPSCNEVFGEKFKTFFALELSAHMQDSSGISLVYSIFNFWFDIFSISISALVEIISTTYPKGYVLTRWFDT